MLSNWNGPSEQCRVESNCRKHKVLPQLKAASFEQMSFHMHIAGTSVMWSIFKRYMFYLPPYFKHTLLLHINVRVAAISFKLSNTYSSAALLLRSTALLFQRAFQLLLLLGQLHYALAFQAQP